MAIDIHVVDPMHERNGSTISEHGEAVPLDEYLDIGPQLLDAIQERVVAWVLG